MNSTNDSLFVVAAIVLTFAVGMATFLNYYKFNSLVGRLMQSRVIVIGNEIQDNVEKSLALGLSLQENNTLQGLIERELRSDDLLKSITLFDTSGTVLYSTESLQQGKKIPEGWLKVSSHSPVENWQVADRNSLVAGLPIRNNFGVTLGQVALSYTRKPLDHCMGIIGNVLFQTALITLMISVTATFLLLGLSFRRYRNELLAAESELELLIKDLDGEVHRENRLHQGSSTSTFMNQISSFAITVRQTANAMDKAAESLNPKSLSP
jgi:hypothetical protein